LLVREVAAAASGYFLGIAGGEMIQQIENDSLLSEDRAGDNFRINQVD